jgi:site-specific DNA recombinase
VDRSKKHPDAWRLPAEQLEGLLSDAVRNRFVKPDAVVQLLTDPSVAEISVAQDRLATYRDHQKAPDAALLELIERVDIKPGSLSLKLGHGAVAEIMKLRPEQIDPDQLVTETCFRMRRRGVELKLHLGVAPTEIDRTLVQNVVKARRWLALIIEGKTFAEIAEAEGTSKRRVQDVIDLALLAPDVTNAIVNGEQPDSLTTDYLVKTGFSAIWAEQSEKFASL